MEGLQQQGAQARPGDEGTRPGGPEGASPTWLSVSDVQRYLGISRPLVYRLIREGTIPAVHLGRAIRVSRAALDRALDALGPRSN